MSFLRRRFRASYIRTDGVVVVRGGEFSDKKRADHVVFLRFDKSVDPQQGTRLGSCDGIQLSRRLGRNTSLTTWSCMDNISSDVREIFAKVQLDPLTIWYTRWINGKRNANNIGLASLSDLPVASSRGGHHCVDPTVHKPWRISS